MVTDVLSDRTKPSGPSKGCWGTLVKSPIVRSSDRGETGRSARDMRRDRRRDRLRDFRVIARGAIAISTPRRCCEPMAIPPRAIKARPAIHCDRGQLQACYTGRPISWPNCSWAAGDCPLAQRVVHEKRERLPGRGQDRVLPWCARHCRLCEKFAGVGIEVAHVDPRENSLDNAIPLCFDCHAAVGHYNQRHPRGRKYSIRERGASKSMRHRRGTWCRSLPTDCFRVTPLFQGSTSRS